MSQLTDAIDELSENEQQARALHSPSPCVVLAPPGSGKTKLLTTRLALDLRQRIPEPHGAACITMTNVAADQLKDRMSELGVGQRSNLFIGTVHAFALRCVVGPYAKLAGLDQVTAASLADEQTQAVARAKAVNEVFRGTENPEAPDVKGTIERRRSLMDYDEAPVELGGPQFALAAKRYEHYLLESGHYDFLDLIRYSVELVEQHEWVLRAVAARFPHIYVDEYQDLPPGLNRLVQSLCFDQRANAELFAVGDPDQAIYGFTGTAPHLVRELADRPTVNDVWLDINYRNPQALIDIALNHLGEERNVQGVSVGGELRAIRCQDGFDEQIRVAVELVEEAGSSGTPLHEIAIMTRFNAELDRLVSTFEDRGIPTFARRERGYRQTPVTSLIEEMAAWSTQTHDECGVRLRDIIRRLRATVFADHSLVSSCIRVMLEFRDQEPVMATEFVESIVRTGLGQAVEASWREDDAQQLHRLRQALAPKGSLEQATLGDFGLRARARGRLHLSTVHGAKGLEFDVVIIADVDQGRMPYFAAKSPREKDEERRMFYVAVTRARKVVYCLWTGWRITKRGFRREDGPSEYLVALGLV